MNGVQSCLDLLHEGHLLVSSFADLSASLQKPSQNCLNSESVRLGVEF